jgi:hypothetical protein
MTASKGTNSVTGTDIAFHIHRPNPHGWPRRTIVSAGEGIVSSARREKSYLDAMAGCGGIARLCQPPSSRGRARQIGARLLSRLLHAHVEKAALLAELVA